AQKDTSAASTEPASTSSSSTPTTTKAEPTATSSPYLVSSTRVREAKPVADDAETTPTSPTTPIDGPRALTPATPTRSSADPTRSDTPVTAPRAAADVVATVSNAAPLEALRHDAIQVPASSASGVSERSDAIIAPVILQRRVDRAPGEDHGVIAG